MAVGNGKLPAWALPIHNLRATRRGKTLASLETLLGFRYGSQELQPKWRGGIQSPRRVQKSTPLICKNSSNYRFDMLVGTRTL